MRKLASRTIETDDLSIEYHVTDESFAYDGFGGGVKVQYGYEIDAVWVCVAGEWVDDELLFTDEKCEKQMAQRKRLNEMIEKCVDADIESNGHFDEPEMDKDRYYEEKYGNE